MAHVGDIKDNREVLRGLLEPLGFIVADVDSGEQCLEQAPSWQPDLIFMDLRMPGLDGLETTRRLRNLPALQEVPIIALSAAAFVEDRIQSKAAGCQAHLAKPIRMSSLLEVLSRYLPLTWQEVEPLISPSLAPQQTSVTYLTKEQHDILLDMLARGNINAILIYLEQLHQQPDCPAQVSHLLSLARNFQIKDIKRLLMHK